MKLHAQITWTRKNIYEHYISKNFSHTSKTHVLLHSTTSKCVFIIDYKCTAFFFRFSWHSLYFWLERYLKAKGMYMKINYENLKI
jgi:hypothetical protein